MDCVLRALRAVMEYVFEGPGSRSFPWFLLAYVVVTLYTIFYSLACKYCPSMLLKLSSTPLHPQSPSFPCWLAGASPFRSTLWRNLEDSWRKPCEDSEKTCTLLSVLYCQY